MVFHGLKPTNINEMQRHTDIECGIWQGVLEAGRAVYRFWRVCLEPTVIFTATLASYADVLLRLRHEFIPRDIEEGQSVTIQALRTSAWEATPNLPQLFSLLPNLHPYFIAIACSGSYRSF